ncbi:MAG: hypothetical protein U5L45_20430 [Saprospiraceae bacterium]|nr:hypothetical protein [Saprospiraceae bacterium]
MKKLIFIALSLSVFAVLPTACTEEGVKLTRADRDGIDTIVQTNIAQITPELDRYCRDSSAILRKYYMDSLLIVRQQEIQQQAVPIQ